MEKDEEEKTRLERNMNERTEGKEDKLDEERKRRTYQEQGGKLGRHTVYQKK